LPAPGGPTSTTRGPVDGGRAVVALIGAAFSGYLLWAQLARIHALCQWCVGNDVIAAVVALLCVARLLTEPDRGLYAEPDEPGVAISRDGRGRFMDNIFIERLWRSIKYEEVHLKAYADGREARAGIGSWMTFYNFRRPHQAMNNQTPMAVWRDGMDKIEAAARAVDMPLRLDNANALPTYPQHNQHEAA